MFQLMTRSCALGAVAIAPVSAEVPDVSRSTDAPRGAQPDNSASMMHKLEQEWCLNVILLVGSVDHTRLCGCRLILERFSFECSVRRPRRTPAGVGAGRYRWSDTATKN